MPHLLGGYDVKSLKLSESSPIYEFTGESYRNAMEPF